MVHKLTEANAAGYQHARDLLVNSPGLNSAERTAADVALQELIDSYGPVVGAYPAWHPLVAQTDKADYFADRPSTRCGYSGLDHTICFPNALVSCPYDASKLLESVRKRSFQAIAWIVAEKLDVPLYNPETTPILIRCIFDEELEDGYKIPKSIAVPLMIDRVMRVWPRAEFAETWETMCSDHFLGEPQFAGESHFVSAETVEAMKQTYLAMRQSEMFGPVH